MPIEFQCNICGTKLRTPDGTAGKKTKCPKCEYILAIPNTTSSMQPDVSSQVSSSQPQKPVTPPQPSTSPQQQTPPPLPPIPPQPVSPQPSAAQPVSNDPDPSDPFGSFPNLNEWSSFGPQSSADNSLGSFGESGNPYQAPADFGPEPVQRQFSGMTRVTGDHLDFSQAFSMTYNAVKNNFLPFFILGVIYLVIYGAALVFGMFLGFVRAADPSLYPVTQIIVRLCSFVENLIHIGLCLCALEVIRKGSTSIATGFSIFTSILSLILFGILMFLLTVAIVGIPAVVFFLIGQTLEQTAGGDLGMIVSIVLIVTWSIVFSIILIFRLGFPGTMLIVDQKISSFAAFQLAWNITKRNTLTLFCIYLVFVICCLLGAAFTLLIGLFVIVPFGLCLSAMCYHIMWEQYQSRMAGQDTSEW